MRRRRNRFNPALAGDGISFEDVLTVITVLLLLRVVFLVPMINLDKAKTESARVDAYWSRQAEHVLENGSDGRELRAYRAAFNLREGKALVTRDGPVVYVEAAAPDSSLLIVRHERESRRFVAMHVHGAGQSRSFRRGRLLWSDSENEWFVGSDTVDYGSHPVSIAMEKAFRNWTREERGY